MPQWVSSTGVCETCRDVHCEGCLPVEAPESNAVCASCALPNCPGCAQSLDSRTNGEAEGLRYDEGKLRWDLIPVEPLEALAKVYTLGAQKYAPNNWRKGMKWSRVLSAMLRHLAAWRKGNRFDQEGGFEHLAAFIWGAITLMEYERLGLGEDDRLCQSDVTPEYVAGLIDGDGCITASYDRKASRPGAHPVIRPIVQIAMTTRPAIDRVAKVYGGVVQEYTRPQVASRKVYQWRCPSSTLPQLLTDIIPHLALKEPQAKLALELWTCLALPGGDGRGGLPLSLHEEKARLLHEIQSLNQNKEASNDETTQ